MKLKQNSQGTPVWGGAPLHVDDEVVGDKINAPLGESLLCQIWFTLNHQKLGSSHTFTNRTII